MLFILLVFPHGIHLRAVKRQARHLPLRLPLHRRIHFLLREIIAQLDVPYHGRLQKRQMLLPAVRVIPHEHVSGALHQHRGDVDGPQQRGKQHTAVHTVDLRRIQRILQRTYPLRIHHIARQARIRHRTVFESPPLQHVPERIHLTVHHGAVSLVAQEAAHDARVQRLPQDRVNHRTFLIHIRRIKLLGAVKPRSVLQHLPVADQTFVDASHAERTHLLAPRLPVHLHRGHHADGFRLRVVAQCLIAPQHVREDEVFLPPPFQHKFRHRPRIKRRFRQFDAHQCMVPRCRQPHGDERLRIPQRVTFRRFNDVGLRRRHRQDGRREDIPSQLVRHLKVVRHRREAQQGGGHADTRADQQNGPEPQTAAFIGHPPHALHPSLNSFFHNPHFFLFRQTKVTNNSHPPNEKRPVKKVPHREKRTYRQETAAVIPTHLFWVAPIERAKRMAMWGRTDSGAPDVNQCTAAYSNRLYKGKEKL